MRGGESARPMNPEFARRLDDRQSPPEGNRNAKKKDAGTLTSASVFGLSEYSDSVITHQPNARFPHVDLLVLVRRCMSLPVLHEDR